MKSLLVIFALVLSSSVMAARLPTLEEIRKIDSILEKSNSLQPVIDLINQNKITPFYGFYKEPISTPGTSLIASSLAKRLNLDNPIGTEEENLKVFKMLSSLGLDFNKQKVEIGLNESSLLSYASNECSSSIFGLAKQANANLGAENSYWVKAMNRGFNYEENSKEDLKCSSLALSLVDFANGMTLETAIRLFTGDIQRVNKYVSGQVLTNWIRQDLQAKLKTKFGIIPSPVPAGDKWSEQWENDFVKMFPYPSVEDNEDGVYAHELWWDKYSPQEKEWACYISSFDEAYHVFKDVIGYTDDQIMHTNLTGAYAGVIFGEFVVKEFVPYCDSLRK